MIIWVAILRVFRGPGDVDQPLIIVGGNLLQCRLRLILGGRGCLKLPPEIPSWSYPFLETKKQGLLDEEMRAIFLAHQERHPTVHIYTDGSKSNEGMGFAAVFPNTTNGGRLTGEASIFTAELYTINAAVHEILKGTIDGNRFTIFSD